MAKYVSVMTGLKLDRRFDYALPHGVDACVGTRVLVPFGPRIVTGYVVAVSDATTFAGTVKPVHEVLDQRPTFNIELMNLLRWTADYYQIPLGELMKKALPPAMNPKETRRVVLTAAGRNHIEADPLLQRLVEGQGSLALKTACQFTTPARLRDLESQGMVQLVTHQPKVEEAQKFLEFVALVPGPTSAVRGPLRQQLVAYLQSHGRTSMEVLKRHFPSAAPIVKALCDAGVLLKDRERVYREVEVGYSLEDQTLNLNPDQESVVATLLSAMQEGAYKPCLLHGVTGSGKTEVYMRVIEAALSLGRSALVLVPEIALTPQLMARFQSRFQRRVAILHSALGPGERLDQWSQVASGDLPLVVGARSAIFAPIVNPGLIIVDEEHETSFKQEDVPFYNARDLALVRGSLANCMVILGSATPSLETYQNSLSGKVKYLSLPNRATPRPLPDVALVDLRKQGFVDSQRILSRVLHKAISRNLELGEQTILFLNRRGYSAFLLCERCGHVPRCTDCSISLTYYQNSPRMTCHYCHQESPVPTVCPVCAQESMKRVGFGTERVVESLAEQFPQARVASLDSSVTRAKQMTAILETFRQGKLDILVGTQVIAKGHDFPNVTLVGVLLADLGLSFPDFRAAERTFQLLTQVAGRAGRGDKTGRVVVQTYMPDHVSLVRAQRHDFLGFSQDELRDRLERHFPPFSALALLRFSGEQHDAVEEAGVRVMQSLGRLPAVSSGRIQLLGPTRAPLAIVRKRLRMQILVRAPGRPQLKHFIDQVRSVLARPTTSQRQISWDIDMDPVNMM